MKNLKGITLITLIITIVVLLILATLTIREITGDGIISRAKEASFKTMMSQYKEQLDVYMLGKRIEIHLDDTNNVASINAGATDRTPKIEIKAILGTEVKKGYEAKIAVEMGELYYVPTNTEDKGVKKEIQWCFELGIKVKGFSTYEDFEYATAPVSNGSYEKVGNTYVNTPDLTGFNKGHTYYVTYDASGNNETIGDIIIKEAPSNWYDYQNKIWANVVTKSDVGNMAYWVWIPRYAYKITYYQEEALENLSENNAVTSYGKVDVKFLSKTNEYINSEGKKTQYTKETLEAEGFQLPDAFSWDGNPIAGYWVSKYEVSEPTPFSFYIEKTATCGIKITNIKNGTGPYKYYLDGKLEHTGKELYTFENLEPLKTHEIKIEDVSGNFLIRNVYIDQAITANAVPKTAPDVSGYKDTIAYYVTYDANGQTETIGDKITFDANGKPTNAPTEGWYNYQNKIWANIVTASEELTDAEKADITNAKDKKIAYWVWIPRYEYRIVYSTTDSDYIEGDSAGLVEVNFIDTNTTTPTNGFKIPDAFSWDGHPIPGYWVSKYEVSE